MQFDILDRWHISRTIQEAGVHFVKVKCLCLYGVTISIIWAALLRGPVRATPRGSSVTKGENRITPRKFTMLGRVKLDNTLLICSKGNFNLITERSRNRTRNTVVPTTHLSWSLQYWGSSIWQRRTINSAMWWSLVRRTMPKLWLVWKGWIGRIEIACDADRTNQVCRRLRKR